VAATVEELFEEVATRLVAEGAERGRMLRSEGLKAGGRFFAFAKGHELVVKLPATRVRELVDCGAGEPFRSGGRVMKEWVTLRPSSSGALTHYVAEAREFVL